jgi:hypothetical protein
MRGGIRDPLAGTFHRYATDRTWHVPHFEKTLYDNAHAPSFEPAALRQKLAAEAPPAAPEGGALPQRRPGP